MALQVDATGLRIRTDILSGGYIRQEIEKQSNLLIPSEIKQLCFEYWFINVCDEWEGKILSDSYKINGQCIKLTKFSFTGDTPSAYGRHIVRSGRFSWQIRFNTDIPWICLGVIEADDELLKKHTNDGQHDNQDYGGSFWNGAQWYSKGRRGEPYGCRCCSKNDIIIITLDMDKHTISYKINDKDYGVASDQMKKDKYRLVINCGSADIELELI